ncbi:MAG: polyphosphate kinase 1 [Chitinophagaceae bacterium]|jgi:polyphosphate kinase|nr:polyphosphate kinase 1 [Chitinophagaceae bacterium]
MALEKRKTIIRDISWLSFNARVLQEANDPTVPLRERVRFLGIFSNNLDEFFRVRVATLKRMVEIDLKAKSKMHLEKNPQEILEQIQNIVLQQQNEFNRIWNNVQLELKKEKIFLVTEKQLNKEQKKFVETFFDEEVRQEVIPLMIESNPQPPYLRERSLYLAVTMTSKTNAYNKKYALIEIPAKFKRRFVKLPSSGGEHYIILMEDVIRFCLPKIFSFMGFDEYSAHIIKVTKDAEIDLESDVSTTLIQKIEKAVKNRRKGKPVRFIYDKEIDAGLLEYLIRRLNLTRRDNIIPGGRIHNFRHFMDFPGDVFTTKQERKKSFPHPALKKTIRVTDEVLKRDLLLHFPYHSFNAIIDLLREAAMDPDVNEIKITAYRLAENSKVINALVNAARNGKKVTVMLELRARFDEEANLWWKERLEEEGVKVLIGVPDMKVHAKICIIKKRINNKTIQYGFVSTGNLNEDTSHVYGDQCLLTSNRKVMADINRIFMFLEKPLVSRMKFLRQCKSLMVCPVGMRRELIRLIGNETKNARKGLPASITLKMNSISDEELIDHLNIAAKAGVELKLIVRGIFCMHTESNKFKVQPYAISIVDQYLEHGRVLIFHNNGKEKVYISSADWMVRNLDHRIEAAVEITDAAIKQELKDYVAIQLKDNVKARILDNDLKNVYAKTKGKTIRSQVEIYNFLHQKTLKQIETGRY